jgi:hypothetical protein
MVLQSSEKGNNFIVASVAVILYKVEWRVALDFCGNA